MSESDTAGREYSGSTDETCADCAALTDGFPCANCYISGRRGFDRPDDADDSTDDPVGPQLRECPVCGAVGLPERVRDHDCQGFTEWRTDQE